MNKFFTFIFSIFLFYTTNSISADYSFEFNGSWLLKDRSDKELASGKVLADFHDMHVIYYEGQPEFFPAVQSSDCKAKAMLNEDTSPIWLVVNCHVSDASGDSFLFNGYLDPSIGGGKNIIHAGTGKYKGIKGNSEWAINGFHLHGGTYAGKITITMPD